MSKVQNPITGQTKGQFATAIFYEVYGKKLMRSKPLKVFNPRSPGQVLNRDRFNLCLSFIKKNLLVFRDGLQSLTNQNSVYNAVMSYYLTNCIQLSGLSYEFIYVNFIFSAGDLQNIAAPTLCEIDENLDISIMFTDNTGTGDAASNDIITFALYNATTDTLKLFTTTRETAALTILQTESEINTEDEIYLYYFSKDSLSTIYSNTVHTIITEAPQAPQALEITFDDIANAPARTLEAWNTLFDLPTSGTPFTSYEEAGNVCKLYGGQNINLTTYYLRDNINLVSFINNSTPILSIVSEYFSGCSILTSIKLHSLNILGELTFNACSSIVNIDLSNNINLGFTSGNDNNFLNIENNNIILTIPHAIESDGDIVSLKANNTVTVIYSD